MLDRVALESEGVDLGSDFCRDEGWLGELHPIALNHGMVPGAIAVPAETCYCRVS